MGKMKADRAFASQASRNATQPYGNTYMVELLLFVFLEQFLTSDRYQDLQTSRDL
jgi:hypothetical protein